MKKTQLLILSTLAIFVVMGCNQAEPEWKAELVVTLDGFHVPESVLHAPKTGVIYVTNMECVPDEYWTDDNKGYLSVVDGSFEQPGSGWSACMASWNPSSTKLYQLSNPGQLSTSPDDSNWMALLSNIGTISQDLGDVNLGDTLTVIFYGGNGEGGNKPGGGVFNCTLTVGAGSNTVQADTTSPQPADTWQAFTNTWVATESGTLTLEFSQVSGNTWIDAISDVKREE